MSLAARSMLGCGYFFFWLALGLFGGAGTFDYPEAWRFLAVTMAGTMAITVYLFRHDRALLERRMKTGIRAEKEKSQKLVLLMAPFCFAPCLLLPALARRWGWPSLPIFAETFGLLLVVTGMGIVWLTFRANSFADATVKIAANHKVIEGGPYAIVRHPMYSGILIVMAGLPLALGHATGLAGLPLVFALLAARLKAEEKFLRVRLAGYADYCRKVKRRLIPALF